MQILHKYNRDGSGFQTSLNNWETITQAPLNEEHLHIVYMDHSLHRASKSHAESQGVYRILSN